MVTFFDNSIKPFALNRYGDTLSRIVFDGKDATDNDQIHLNLYEQDAPDGWHDENGVTTAVAGTGTAGAVPVIPDSQTLCWTRVTDDGTTVTVQCQAVAEGDPAPTESSWASVPACYSSTAFANDGGMIGFANNSWNGEVSHLTIKSWDAATSAFDITEDQDSFTADANDYVTDTYAYDADGNMTYDGTQVYTYDAWNRLVAVAHGYRDSSGDLQHGQTSAAYSYDGLNRRITKAITNTGDWDCTYHYYYSGQRQIEARNGSDIPIQQYVWGLSYIDELIQTAVNTDLTGTTCDQQYWAMQDTNYNVLGIVDSTGVLKERYEYTPYGQRTVFMSAGVNDPNCYAPILASQRVLDTNGEMQPYSLCPFGHQGLMHDDMSGLIYNRARYLQPTLGMFLQEDPKEYIDGLSIFNAEGANPVNHLDSMGLKWSVSRKGKPRAIATGHCGDTVNDLSKKIKLSSREFKKWLQPYVAMMSLPATAGTPLSGKRKFTIPNTAYLDKNLSDFHWAIGGLMVGVADAWEKEWKSAGYDFVYDSSPTKPSIMAHLVSPNIYVYGFIGEGDASLTGGLIEIPSPSGYSELYANKYTKYGIADMRLEACYAGAGRYAAKWASNVSKEGWLSAWTGAVNAYHTFWSNTGYIHIHGTR